MARDLITALTVAREEIRVQVENKPVGKLYFKVELKDWVWWDRLLLDLMVYVQTVRDERKRREQGNDPVR